jgi:hypothetical protein
VLTDDHIVPPHDGVPADAAPCNVGFKNTTARTTTCMINTTNFCAGAKNLTACRDYAAAHTACPERYDDVQANGECAPFDFRRLGLRATALLLSPWVQEGGVFQQPRGPSSTSQFEHSSISATLKNLYNLSDFLTVRELQPLQCLAPPPCSPHLLHHLLPGGPRNAMPGPGHCTSCCLTCRGQVPRCQCTCLRRRHPPSPGPPTRTSLRGPLPTLTAYGD